MLIRIGSEPSDILKLEGGWPANMLQLGFSTSSFASAYSWEAKAWEIKELGYFWFCGF